MKKPHKMLRKKVRKFIDANVYEEAINRIHHIYDTFDTIVVLFSGGKDSLATLHLVKEVAEARNLRMPINVIFRDEELINEVVVDFVNQYRKLEWVSMNYFAVPMYSQKYVLGTNTTYVQWDKSRKHIRPIPKHAIQTTDADGRVFSQTKMDSYMSTFYKGKIAFVNGIRSSESLTRYASCMAKLNENYINDTKANTPNVRLCKPIFDWQEDDVFKYFYDNKIEYCNIYDWQMWNSESLRVATPVHAENAKRFYKLRTLDPTLYEQIIDVFPDMIVQDRYAKEFDSTKIKKLYDKDLQSVLRWIKIYVADPKQKHEAYYRFKDPTGYSVEHILNYFMSGAYKRRIIPLSKKE